MAGGGRLMGGRSVAGDGEEADPVALAGQVAELGDVADPIDVAGQVAALALHEEPLDEKVDELVEQTVLERRIAVHELECAQHVVDLGVEPVTQLVRVHDVGIPASAPNTSMSLDTGSATMLMRFDPFRELDRAVDQLSQRAGPATIPFDAVRRADEVVVYFDMPGVDPDAIDLTVERNVLTLRAERRYEPREDEEILATERRQGVFARQLYLGEVLDTTSVQAKYDHGVLTVSIPLARQAQPRRVTIGQTQSQPETIEAEGADTTAEQGPA